MRRSLLFVVVALALLVSACAEQIATPTAAVSSSPRPTGSIPRGAAMERGDVVTPCPSPRPVWASPGMCGGADDGGGVRADYYFNVSVAGGRFRPASFPLSLSAQIQLANVDNVVHNITIPASGISLDVEVGAEDFTRPITLEPGRYAFFCRFHRDEGMRGVITMTPNRDLITVRRGY